MTTQDLALINDFGHYTYQWIMTEDEFNQQNNQFNQRIDELDFDYQKAKVNLEEDYDNKRRTLQKQIEENNQSLDFYRNRGQSTLNGLDYLHSKRIKGVVVDYDYKTNANRIYEQYQQRIVYYQKIDNQLNQELTDAKNQFENSESQLQAKHSKAIRKIEEKIDDLNNQYYE